MKSWLISFLSVGLAEFGDKTQLTVLMLSARVRNRTSLLFGVLLAFILVDGVAAFVGCTIAAAIPLRTVKLFAGVVFVLFGFLILLGQTEEENGLPIRVSSFGTVFGAVFLAEVGDKTQIAVAALSAVYNPLSAFLGAISALMLLSAVSILIGSKVRGLVGVKTMNMLSAAVFFTIGISFILIGC